MIERVDYVKKIISVILVILMCFAVSSCSSKDDKGETQTKEYKGSAPILGVQIAAGDNAGYKALTKDGTYMWTATDDEGNTEKYEHSGIFCLDDKNLCTLTRNETNGKISLNFVGSVSSHEVYCAPKDEIEDDRLKIYDEKYLITTSSKTITFPQDGAYYYVIKVNYTQGEVAYGFLLNE